MSREGPIPSPNSYPGTQPASCKTDALDAEVPPRFAEVIGPEPRSLADVGTFRLRELAVGVAPFNRDSGRWRGKGRQGCGEGGAVHGNVGGDQMESYPWLIRARRPVKVALVACM
ncbi:hypothetical protein J7K76_02075, partial [Candidatus Bipolaricaulota bacterium]|nr:hypothetical protein [Candidatus Bipolaricaulota bacterium]